MWKSEHIETNTIHGGKTRQGEFGPLATPIYQTSTFVFDSVEQGAERFAGEAAGHIYSRLGNPTVDELEARMALLENTEAAAAFGSGMGAVSAAVLGLLKQGDHLVTSHRLYGCTFALFNHQLPAFGIEVSFVDLADAQAVKAAIRPNTKVIYGETPINPCLSVANLDDIAAIAKAHKLVSIIDNTFMSPVLQQPAKHGIDIVLHSATKFLNGHGDVVAGILCGPKDLIDQIKMTTRKDMGAIISPHDAWLIIRGLKTLHLRVARHNENAQKLAEFLSQHPMVAKVDYPGLPGHPGFALLGKQMHGGGGVLAFELKGNFDQAVTFMNQLQMCKRAVSLGDAETLIQHPASMTHSTYEPEELAAAGIPRTLIRLAAGLEHLDDIVADLSQALQAAAAHEKAA
ncbi:PLP-dependent aspartate aminotransferase family protein [Simiduia sp. 21SJ11W-1]|uniref:trans-sulfuration enzyme family protein n=1 Tax=Simiduia sp. 21SJ11W-1 TaxID=2909669 RepID=UPI00209DC5B6|nr:PLP-dependent aspartate aminotransferase family protein [Simiduia sp. 21SJ11W-1]UTA47737.1 PLP-dependent aspartate aminotransferase family protein [Simiduia sp. 21SJ11W-1]